MEHAGDRDINRSWSTWNCSQRLERGSKNMEIAEKIETIQTAALLRSGRILKGPGGLKRLAVTLTLVKNLQRGLDVIDFMFQEKKEEEDS